MELAEDAAIPGHQRGLKQEPRVGPRAGGRERELGAQHLRPGAQVGDVEYGQRLTARRRNILARGPDEPSVGARLFEDALAGGAQALGRPIGRLAPGARADLLVIDPERPNLHGRTGDLFLDALVFAGNDNPVTGVMVGGGWRVRDGRHAREDEILAAYKIAVAELAV